jgi:hypothetical protein
VKAFATSTALFYCIFGLIEIYETLLESHTAQKFSQNARDKKAREKNNESGQDDGSSSNFGDDNGR